ncbi:GDSL-like Lipase/Acylhydrolase [Posidoniimonas corsicana]|uniref:GDSL-like Lipase/Acylhydrolase n=1 Tax=Posidoniimonas corsicana TaxID=1938618 RepID=A0A5C5UZP1_9BACT|nr:GDSL-type esterase/lipase family protein [Posidoniimonas corsicana]TWT31090.1 GDSL-like Lipase/Acylhydrolase [Posidoniimonas corsicana]
MTNHTSRTADRHGARRLLGAVDTGRVATALLCLAVVSTAPAAESGASSRERTLAAAARAHKAVKRTDPNSVLAHQQLLEKTKYGQIDLYFVGDSITRRWGGTDYPEYLKHWQESFHGWNAANFAWGGDNTHNILWRLRNGELDGVEPKVVVLQAGTNNLPWQGAADASHVDDIVTGVQAILHEFATRTPDAKIILVGLFARPQNPGAAEAINEANKCLAELADGDAIRYLDINEGLVATDGKARPGVFSDGLHLGLPGYIVWEKALNPVLIELLGPPAKEDHAPPPTGDPSAKR